MTTDSTSALALIPRGLEEAEKMATKLSKSSMLPEHFRDKPENVFWALAYGLEIGFTPVQSLQAIYVVHGRPGMYADAMVALILTSGKAEFFHCVESDAKHATYETKRKGAPKVRTLTVTMEDAQTAGWTSNAKYKSEPRRMLEARCKSQLARDVYPDVLRGMEAVEDIQDDGPGGPRFTAPPPTTGKVIDIIEKKAEPAATAPVEQPAAAAGEDSDLELAAKVLHKTIVETKSVESLAALIEELSALTKQLGKDHALSNELRAAYKNQKKLLEKAGGQAA